MPLKSWSFRCRGRPVRAEVSWRRLSGWSRQRLYVGHELAAERRGRAQLGLPLAARLDGLEGEPAELEVRFRRTWLGLGAACQVLLNGGPPGRDEPPARVEWGIPVGEEVVERPASAVRAVAGFVCIPMFLGLVLALLILAIPLILLGVAVGRVRDALFRWRMRRRGRFLVWAEVDPRMAAGPGTLVLEYGNAGLWRAWWTEEDVLGLCTIPRPRRGEGNPPPRDPWERLMSPFSPFIEWCHFHYLGEETGRAYLTPLRKGLDFSEGPEAAWRSAYPGLRVVWVPAVRRERVPFLGRFLALLGDDARLAVPALVEALGDAQAPVRSMALDTLGALGPDARGAVPALLEHLHEGPQDERVDAARSLAATGPEGVDALVEASRRGDPWVRYPAALALQGRDLPTAAGEGPA